MKKIVFFILMLFSGISFASAKEIFYSDYSEFSEYSLNKINASDLVIEGVERRYKWYKESIDGEFLEYKDGIRKYKYVDLNNYQEQNFSEFNDIVPENIVGRVIDKKTLYKIRKAKPIRYLNIYNMDTSLERASLGRITIYQGDKEIGYTATCGNCDNGFAISKSGFITIDLVEPYYLQDLKIVVDSGDLAFVNSFNILATYPDETGLENVYFSYTFTNNNSYLLTLTSSDWNKANPQYEEEKVYDYIPINSNLDLITINNLYRYQDTLYYSYNIKKEYVDGYYTNYDGYTKDMNNYLDFYHYKYRNKIEISDDIEITTYNQKLSDFVFSTTNYNIETNLDYLKNGTYQVKYITDYITVEKSVTVNIKGNELNNAIEEKEDVIDNKDKEAINNKVPELIDNKDKEVIYEKNNTIKLSNNQIEKNIDNNLETKYNKLTEENKICNNLRIKELEKSNDNEKKLILSNKVNDYMKSSMLKINNNRIHKLLNVIIFIIFELFILLIIISLKKKSKKN